ncbi:MAG: hypothetical protein KOO66_01345 [Bacteroidales bacterium]|nr:hypothetical protein [Bacteroidales bacterium]
MERKLKIVHWLPRIICILAILFVSLFALDAFGSGSNIWQQIGSFIKQLIPSFILLAFLLIAWKWENIGGLVFMIIGFGISPFVFMHNYKMNHSIWMSLGIILMITFPFIIVGVLFLVSHKIKKNK